MASPKSFDTASNISRYLAGRMAIIDTPLPAQFQATNEVQQIAAFSGTATGGTFTLTITLFGGTLLTTAAIVYNASAATIQSAIDVAAAGVVPGWTNGDIVVAGGPFTVAAVTFTYSGNSVSGKNHSQISINGASLVGATNEVQQIAVYNDTATGGTFQIVHNSGEAESFTTAPIAYDASAATIQTAIDVAATGVVTGWANGHIAVTGGPLTTTPVTITYSGDSVDGINWPTIVIIDSVT